MMDAGTYVTVNVAAAGHDGVAVVVAGYDVRVVVAGPAAVGFVAVDADAPSEDVAASNRQFHPVYLI